MFDEMEFVRESCWNDLQEKLNVMNLPKLDDTVQALVKQNFFDGFELGWLAVIKPKWVEMEEAAELQKSGWKIVCFDNKSRKFSMVLMCPPVHLSSEEENG